ncbi:hypothetical protein [Streptomyces filamentosus]|uniref:hypothetical protein n=1 Tax=Streptomyces filamentosus TaxID=67294 RepID=UPI0033C5FD57
MNIEPTHDYPAERAEYLEEVRAREAAATDGSWDVYDGQTLVEVVAGLEENSTGYRCRRQIARLDEEPIDNIREHADWDADQDYGQLLADAEFIAKARTDVPQLLGIIETLTGYLAKAREFRIPLTNEHGGYSELTVERGPGPYDGRWAVTDGARGGRRVWHHGTWYYISEIGPALAYRHTLEEALALGEKAAAAESARLDAALQALKNEQPNRSTPSGTR